MRAGARYNARATPARPRLSSATRGSDVRKVALTNLLLERTVARQSWIAEHLVMRSAANVSQQVRRYRLSKPQLPPKLKTYLSAVKIC